MRSNGDFSGYQFFVFSCSAPEIWHLAMDVSPENGDIAFILGCCLFLGFPHDVFQHLFFVVSDAFTEQCEEYPDELAAYGYDRLFLFQRIVEPLCVVLMQRLPGLILADE